MTILKNPSHPGEVLKELYLDPLGMGSIALAKRLNVPRTRVERLVKGETSLIPAAILARRAKRARRAFAISISRDALPNPRLPASPMPSNSALTLLQEQQSDVRNFDYFLRNVNLPG